MATSIEGSPGDVRDSAESAVRTPTYAEAGRLVYDLAAGTIEFSGECDNHRRWQPDLVEYLVYNIIERRINASGIAGQGDGVKAFASILHAGPPMSRRLPMRRRKAIRRTD